MQEYHRYQLRLRLCHGGYAGAHRKGLAGLNIFWIFKNITQEARRFIQRQKKRFA